MRGISNSSGKDGTNRCSKTEVQKCNNSGSLKKGSLRVVGIGPGGSEHITKRAISAIDKAEVIVGYITYIELLEEGLKKGKEVISTGMMKEIERCKIAIEKAKQGKSTAIVSGGDPGIYGMAGLILELLSLEDLIDKINLEIIPGVPALCAASALLGAPIMHDFVSISLSDLMTPWELIKKRIILALEGDFVIVLYNPSSKKRKRKLKEAIELIREKKGDKVPVGIVKDAAREGEKIIITDIRSIDPEVVDMRTILIIGNSTTKIHDGFMITPRGYEDKYESFEKFKALRKKL